MKKTIGIIAIILLMLVTLTGCVKVDYEVKINKNGSGEITYICGLSKEMLTSLQVNADEIVAPLREQAEEKKYNIENYEDETIVGFKANKSIEDLTKDFSLQEAFGENYVKAGEEGEDNHIKIERTFSNTKYSQNAKIDLTNMKEFKGNAEIIYRVKLPAKVDSNNAEKVSNNEKELEWQLEPGEINEIQFEANKSHIVLIDLITLAVIAVIVVIVVVIKLTHKKKTIKKVDINIPQKGNTKKEPKKVDAKKEVKKEEPKKEEIKKEVKKEEPKKEETKKEVKKEEPKKVETKKEVKEEEPKKVETKKEEPKKDETKKNN